VSYIEQSEEKNAKKPRGTKHDERLFTGWEENRAQ